MCQRVGQYGGAPECQNRSEVWSLAGFGLVHGDIGVIVVAVCLVPFELKGSHVTGV